MNKLLESELKRIMVEVTLRAAIKQKDEHKPINYLDPIPSTVSF